MPPPLLDELSPIHSRPPLSRVSRYTARFHLPAAAFDGLVAGAFTLSDVVLRKTFGASALLITLMVMAQPVSQLLAIVWGRLMHGRSKRPFILGFGGIGRLSLILVAFAGTAVTFAVPIVVSIALAVAIIPALNALYQSNYPNSERGRVFGQVLSMTAVATIASSMAAGWWMDHDAGAYRIIYPLTGIIGLAGIYLYWRIRPRAGLPADDSSDQKEDLSASDWFEAVYDAVRHPFRGAKTIFTTDPNFLRFEIGYMLYGLGFMMLQPVLPLCMPANAGLDICRRAEPLAVPVESRFVPVLIVLPQPAFGAACRIQIGHAAAQWIRRVIGALAGVRRLAPPIAVKPERIGRAGELQRVRDAPCMRERSSEAFRLEAIIRKRIAVGVGEVFRLCETRIGNLAVLTHQANTRSQLVTRSERPFNLEEKVVELEPMIGPHAVERGRVNVPQKPEAGRFSAHRGVKFGVAVRAARGLQRGFKFGRRVRSDVVDHPADRVWAKPDLAGALQDLDPFKAPDRWVGIGGVVAIGPISDRQPVLKQKHFRGSDRR